MKSLTSLIERFLGVPPAGPGQGTAWNFSHSFPWPPWLLLLFAIAAAAYVWMLYRRDATGLSR